MTILPTDDPVAKAAIGAIQSGDVDGLTFLLAENPSLASAGIGADATGLTSRLRRRNPCGTERVRVPDPGSPRTVETHLR